MESNTKEIERICNWLGERGKKYEEEVENKGYKEGRIYCMCDGSMIYIRGEGWKEIKLGRIFSDGDRATIHPNRNIILNSAYTAYIGTAEEFLNKWGKRLPGDGNNVVFIGDGAKWIWDFVEMEYPSAIKILDFYHASEYIAEWGRIAIKEDKERREWIDKGKGLMLENRIEMIIEEIKNWQMDNKKDKDKILGYFENNKDKMMYGSYREMGLMIGSGAIESAHREIIQKRLKRSGQRWSKKGAQSIADLRSIKKSGLWKNFIKMSLKTKEYTNESAKVA